MLSFGWLAGNLVTSWTTPRTPQQIIDRFGLAPGSSAAPEVPVPLSREPRYGGMSAHVCPAELVAQVSRAVAHNGSDVSIALGTPFSGKGAGHASLRALWWQWDLLFKTRWKFATHINALEMRMIYQALAWRARDPNNFSKRFLRLADLMVSNYILSKGRTSSRLLQPLTRRIAALQLALNGHQFHGHVDSLENPTDHASRY